MNRQRYTRPLVCLVHSELCPWETEPEGALPQGQQSRDDCWNKSEWEWVSTGNLPGILSINPCPTDSLQPYTTSAYWFMMENAVHSFTHRNCVPQIREIRGTIYCKVN